MMWVMAAIDERIRQILDTVRSSGIGLRQRSYDGDVADLLKEGRTDFAPAAAITLYFDGPRERFADGVVACWEEFLDAWGSGLKWYADDDHGKWRPATARLLQRPVQRIANRKAMPLYGWLATSAEAIEHAAPVEFSALVRDGGGKNLSFVRATFPVARVADATGAAEFLDMAKRWCDRIPIRHGYGGLTINQAIARGDRQLNSGMLPRLAERFPGFEIDDCMGTVLVARDQIKGVNWLTLLGGDFLQRLGGLSALRSSPSEALVLHPAGHGAVIVQAGRIPTRGDTQQGDDLSLYQEVARALRPICLDSHPPIGAAEAGSFSPEGMNRWLRRFDV